MDTLKPKGSFSGLKTWHTEHERAGGREPVARFHVKTKIYSFLHEGCFEAQNEAV